MKRGLLLLLLTAHTALGAPLAELPFSQLSQVDPNPLGEKALAIQPQQWKHAETAHFIYHYVHSYVANPVAVEAEFYYRVIAGELEREPSGGDTKSHIYIFEKPEQWQEFQRLGQLEPWTGGIHSGGSLFIMRDPGYKFQSSALGHEIVHLFMHRLYPGGIPSWLDEGLAEHISEKAYASFHRARGYISKPTATAIAPGMLMPLSTLLAQRCPPNDNVELFYHQSQRLVRFLAATDRASFLAFVDAIARHSPFETALARFFAAQFTNVAMLEERFRVDASRNFGTTLQQADRR